MSENVKTEIVISGFSGRFPDTDSVDEFYEKLVNKVDTITEDDKRFEAGIYGIPKRFGKMKDISKFDSKFFGLNSKETHEMDPQGRISLEVTYEAIVDAGYNPAELRGKKIGVFMGNCFCHLYLAHVSKDRDKLDGQEIQRHRRGLIANSINHVFDFKGPSMNIDVACASSAQTFNEAYQSIRSGDCTAAIVIGSNYIQLPYISLGFKLLKMISKDGKSKTFDKSVDGYVRSEAVAAVFLQKYEDARRNYASIVHMKTNNDGYKIEGITFPSHNGQKDLLSEVWRESKLDPSKIAYVEAHATGTVAGDVTEMSVIDEVFCCGREKPLLVGSMKSNMGHSEGASSVCQIVKIILSSERGVLPPNMYFNEPHPEIKALVEGRAKVVTEPTPFNEPYIAVNSFGFGGSNMHCILKSNLMTSLPENKKDNSVPHLLLYCGRTLKSVQFVFDSTTVGKAPREFFALLHKSSYTSPTMKPYRGYKLLGTDKNIEQIKLMREDKRQLWYTFSGIASQCIAVIDDLMQIETFAKSLQKSMEILKPFQVDFQEMFPSEHESDILIKFKINGRKIIPAIVAGTALQIALIDVLNQLGLKPDGIIGQCHGELLCAYADSCMTARQTLLASYWLAKVIEESYYNPNVLSRLRALGYIVPEFCTSKYMENSEATSEVVEKDKKIIAGIKSENVFNSDIKTGNIADNSKNVLPDIEKLRIHLKKVIQNPKMRSSRWINCSYPESEWNDPETKFASASFFLRSLFSPGFFDDALQRIPPNAVVVEIGPRDTHSTMLKKEIILGDSHFSLIKEDGNHVVHLLSSIGKLYISGFNPDIEKLYPAVAFPVPRNTPVISSLIKWDHSESWKVNKWDASTLFPVSIEVMNLEKVHSPNRYLLGHRLDERYLYPATKYIYMVYTQFVAKYHVDLKFNMPVVFEKVKFMRATLISETHETRFTIHISKISGYFEVIESGMVVCNGYVRSPTRRNEECITSDFDLDKKSLALNTKDIYKEFRIRGYEYGPSFQGILAANLSGTEGILKWTDNLVTYMDALLQFSMISLNKRAFLLPIRIDKLTIDGMEHKRIVEKAVKEYEGIPVKCNAQTQEFFSGGVYIRNVHVGYKKKKPSSQVPILEQHKFFPYEVDFPLDVQTTLHKEYIDICSSISERILKRFGKDEKIREYVDTSNVSEELIDKYLKSEENCYVLLKCLSQVLSSPEDQNMVENVKSCVSVYVNEIETDILSQILLEDSVLRSVCDVIIENLPSLNTKLVEIAEGPRTISFKFNEYNPNPIVVKIAYSIVHCDTELLCKDYVPPNANVIAWENKPSLEFQDVDLFILNQLKCSISDIKIILKNVAACLQDEGFILVLVKTKLVQAEVVLSSVGGVSIPFIEETYLEQSFEEIHLSIICKIFNSFASTLYLLRKSKKYSGEDLIVHITAHEYDQWVDDLKEKMKLLTDSSSSKRMWLVSENSCYSGILGLVNSLHFEPGGFHIRCVFTGKENSEIPKFSLNHPFYRKQLEKNLVMNVFQHGSWGSYRHILYKEGNITTVAEHAYLNVLTIGDLSSFAWVPLSLESLSLADDEVICHVYYSSLNFRDVMVATGRIPLLPVTGAVALEDCQLGSEFSGRTSDGKRVMGLTVSKGMATTVIANRKLLWDVPDEWTLEQAATVPIVYATAYNALVMRGKLQEGESVLIHSGSGGVGQAAIVIALHVGCDIYTTVGSEEKREFLKKKFPQLQEEHIYNSRDTNFEQHILRATKGKGVDIILNSIAEEKLIAGLNCLSEEGRFLEIGKYDMFNNTNIGMDIFLKNISFHGICLDVLIQDHEDNMRTSVTEFIDPLKNIIAEGIVKPLDTTVFSHEEVEQAFRYIATGKHIGKVLLKIREEETEKNAIPSPVHVNALKKTTFDPKKSYIIIGGLGGMGLELCQWLIERRAKNIILTSRSGVTTGYQKLCLQRWEQDSVNVVISKLDATKLDEARSLLILAAKFGHVGGIFNLAIVLKDGFVENQTVQNFIDVCNCKVESTKNLDTLTRELYPAVDWFVCFSSISCGRGFPSQSNYAYANSVMERICEDRVCKGFAGLAIQWGLVGDVGVAEETMGSSVIVYGTVPQRISSCLEVLDKFLQQRHPVVSSVVPYNPDKSIKNLNTKDLISYMANIFGIKDVNLINPESTLSELGMDSLMAVELRQILESNFDTVFTIPQLQKLKVKELKQITGHDDTESMGSTTQTEKFDIRMYLEKYKISKDIIPVEVIIHMNTITDGLPLFLVHSIEGSIFSLNTLAESFSCPVYGIQSTVEAPRDSIESLASFYWKHVKSLNIPLQSINLVGYSFGAAIAFEMTLQAEQDPQDYPDINNLIFLDGSHSFTTTVIRMVSSRFDERMENIADQITALITFSTKFSGDNLFLDNKELFNLKSFTERKCYTANKIASLYQEVSVDDILLAFDMYSSKLQMSFRYNPKYKLKKDVHLLKSSGNCLTKYTNDLYDLHHVCEGKVTSTVVEGSHSNFIQEKTEEVSNLLKGIFDNE